MKSESLLVTTGCCCPNRSSSSDPRISMSLNRDEKDQKSKPNTDSATSGINLLTVTPGKLADIHNAVMNAMKPHLDDATFKLLPSFLTTLPEMAMRLYTLRDCREQQLSFLNARFFTPEQLDHQTHNKRNSWNWVWHYSRNVSCPKCSFSVDPEHMTLHKPHCGDHIETVSAHYRSSGVQRRQFKRCLACLVPFTMDNMQCAAYYLTAHPAVMKVEYVCCVETNLCKPCYAAFNTLATVRQTQQTLSDICYRQLPANYYTSGQLK